MAPAELGQTIDALLGRYGLARRGPARAIADSVLNENYRVETDRGPRFVRRHKARMPRERLEATHRAVQWAQDQGLAAVAPLSDGSGRAVHVFSQRLWAVYPWVEGRTLPRGRLTSIQAATLGELHGRAQAVLAAYDDPALPDDRADMNWRTENTISALSRIDELIGYDASPNAEAQAAQDALRYQLSLLESGAAPPPAAFAGLPRQVCHGDFHERNVLVDAADQVVALVDWERVRPYPATWELLRAVDFMGLLDDAQLSAYVGAFGRHRRFTAGEVALGVEHWWQVTLHGTWTLTTRYIEGERGVSSPRCSHGSNASHGLGTAARSRSASWQRWMTRSASAAATSPPQPPSSPRSGSLRSLARCAQSQPAPPRSGPPAPDRPRLHRLAPPRPRSRERGRGVRARRACFKPPPNLLPLRKLGLDLRLQLRTDLGLDGPEFGDRLAIDRYQVLRRLLAHLAEDPRRVGPQLFDGDALHASSVGRDHPRVARRLRDRRPPLRFHVVNELVRIRRLHPDARLPFRATAASSGWDLFARLDAPVTVGQHPVLIGTGIALEAPGGIDTQIRPRSGLARKGIVAVFGTLDADYRGELLVTLYAVAPGITHTVEDGDRIAQIVFTRLAAVDFVEAEVLSSSERGAGGHGSTGR